VHLSEKRSLEVNQEQEVMGSQKRKKRKRRVRERGSKMGGRGC